MRLIYFLFDHSVIKLTFVHVLVAPCVKDSYASQNHDGGGVKMMMIIWSC